MVTAARFKKLALSFPDATEVPHMERMAYRTPRKMFATLAPDGRSANLLLSLEVQDAVVEAMPRAFMPVPGGWGRMGYTTVDLGAVDEVELVRALEEAHAMAAPKKAPLKKSAVKKNPATSARKKSARKTPRRGHS